MSNYEKNYEQVGNIRIKESKKKKTSDTPLLVKLIVWIMLIAMTATFFVPLILYLHSVISAG